MTGEPRGFSRVAAGFSSYDGDLSLPLGLALGPNLPLGLRGKAGGGARVTAGPKRPHLSVESGGQSIGASASVLPMNIQD